MWDVYQTLSASRPQGFGPGAITFESMVCYGNYYGIRGDEFDRMVYYIQAMDQCFLAHAADKNKRDE